MSRQIGTDLIGVVRGLQRVVTESLKLQDNYAKHLWANSSVKTFIVETNIVVRNRIYASSGKDGLKVDNFINETIERTSMIPEGFKALIRHARSPEEEVKTSSELQNTGTPNSIENNILTKNYNVSNNSIIHEKSPGEIMGTRSIDFDSKLITPSSSETERFREMNDRKLELTQHQFEEYPVHKLPLFKIGQQDSETVSQSNQNIEDIRYVSKEKQNETSQFKHEGFSQRNVSSVNTEGQGTKESAQTLALGTEKSQQEVEKKSLSSVTEESVTFGGKSFVASSTQTKDLPKKVNLHQKLSETARQRKVPSSRVGRMFSFGTLAAGLGVGTVAEFTRRSLGLADESKNQTLDALFLTPANAERIVSTLCKVRGAALKIGQLLSIQDSNVISPVLQEAFERVRQSADFMPQSQVEKVLRSELGKDWHNKFLEFEMKPFAAASIGQVHRGKLLDETEVAVKIQYPGVAEGINSDIDNLFSVLNVWNIFPSGMFIDKLIEVAKRELAWEVDYVREAECTRKFRQLLKPYPEYYVPKVIDELCTKKVFASELIEGVPVDKCRSMELEERNHICKLIMHLCLKELFEFRYMQTDPNWSNFFYNKETKNLILLDFGASRSYEKKFMDNYLKLIKGTADKSKEDVLKLSREMGFLTGFESKAMEDAHTDALMILGEVFTEKVGVFDFGRQDTVIRMTRLVPTILNERLCPPPEEIYSLHRKLSGVFLLCAKLEVKICCRELFMNIYNNYVFDS